MNNKTPNSQANAVPTPMRPARAVRQPQPAAQPPVQRPTAQRTPAQPAAQPAAQPPIQRPTAQRTPAQPAAQPAAQPPIQRPIAQRTPAQPAAQSAAQPPIQRPTAQRTLAQPAAQPAAQPPIQRPTAQRTPAQPAAQPAAQPPIQRPTAQRTPAQPAAQPAAQRVPRAVPMPTPAQRRAADAPTTQVDIASRPAQPDDSATRQIAVKPQKKRAPEPKPEKKKKHMSEGAATLLSVVKAITYIVFVIVIAGFLSYYTIRIANDMFAFVKSDEHVTITIPENATIYDVSEALAEAGVIEYPDVFVLYSKLNHDNGKFVAGDYGEINGMMNYDELLMAFKEHNVRERIWITIPEGYTIDEIIALFIEKGVGMVERTEDNWETANRADYVAAVNNLELYAEYFEFVRLLMNNPIPNRTYALEGYLFPDTYEFYTDSKPSQIIYKLLSRFNSVFKEEFYTRAADLGYTVDEIITLASMIEKETRLYYEFEQVSSVFHNRLRDPANYPYLESDATIMYAIHHDTGERKEEMTGADTAYVSPYNTYTNTGLPPGPIANPSYQAITCALYPEDTAFYYFVSRKNGETIFSKTFPEHQAAVAEVAREG